jgi:hypothetical protein
LDVGFGFRQELVEKPIGLTFELIYPILGLPQLSRELMCQSRRAVAILVRRVQQIRNEGRISRIGIPVPKLLFRSDGLLAHADVPSGKLIELDDRNSGGIRQADSLSND